MEVGREKQRRTETPSRQLLLALAFGAGALVGWLVLGWWLFPVQWRNAKPTDLAPGYQIDYLAMVADSYAQNGDLTLARQRLEGFDPERIREVADYLESEQLTLQAQRLRNLVQVAGQPVSPTAAPATPTTEPQMPAVATTLGQRLRLVGGVILLTVLLIIGVVAGAAWLASRGGREARPAGVEEPRTEAAPSWMVREATLEYPVTAGFMAGNSGYKESFQIKDSFQRLLGDCGLMVAEGLGTVPGDQVPALQLWLYDKEDGRTESITLLSEHAFRDRSLFAQLEGAGRVERAEAGKVLYLETANLRLEAEILGVSYVEAIGDLPPNAYFARLDVQLTPTAKEQGPEEGWPTPEITA